MAGVASARVANRHALHSVYYSTAKKPAFPLNETCTRPLRDALQRDFESQVQLRIAVARTRHNVARAFHKFKNAR